MWSTKKIDINPVTIKNGLFSNLESELKELLPSNVLVLQSTDHMISLSKNNRDGFLLYDENRTPSIAEYKTGDELIRGVTRSFNNPNSDESIRYIQYQNTTLLLAISIALLELKSQNKTITTPRAPGGPSRS